MWRKRVVFRKLHPLPIILFFFLWPTQNLQCITSFLSSYISQLNFFNQSLLKVFGTFFLLAFELLSLIWLSVSDSDPLEESVFDSAVITWEEGSRLGLLEEADSAVITWEEGSRLGLLEEADSAVCTWEEGSRLGLLEEADSAVGTWEEGSRLGLLEEADSAVDTWEEGSRLELLEGADSAVGTLEGSSG